MWLSFTTHLINSPRTTVLRVSAVSVVGRGLADPDDSRVKAARRREIFRLKRRFFPSIFRFINKITTCIHRLKV